MGPSVPVHHNNLGTTAQLPVLGTIGFCAADKIQRCGTPSSIHYMSSMGQCAAIRARSCS
ncbi:hypothetical protein PISMIDRAFT_673707 [Pisolithus microcarpus 441]|uniref:Uncharacterized protein n=1 Tax=Pisolithus microcarpus 441 TaxID=765257 RepID=A0A0C9ZHA9_9AGAM|nr:hypothetical protein PISMIDRAFT_673707 [Pisolithus microcarpus 441]